MTNNKVKYRPIQRLLIANRGEIAARVVRTAKKMGITTIGIVTESEPQTTADEAVMIKGSSLVDTYLNIEKIIEAALFKQADAIHPGYGFLSENSSFAKATERAGILFIGPTADVIEQMGDKTNARLIAQSLNIPVAKGFVGSAEEIYSQKQKLPYPVLVKAAAGGGGKAMLMVASPTELHATLIQAQREAERYFGDSKLLVEQLIHQPRHIEVQVIGDNYGNYLHLYERECSIQRRYQKIIEESPSPFVTNALREKLTTDALKLCKQIGYKNVGTVEFLVDQEENYYFLEMNTRLQVEHPVTEMVTSIDLVEQQLNIAMGLPLSITQKEIKLKGHAVECRIYAENPQNNFQPAPGKISKVQWAHPNIARTDSWFDHPIEIQPQFDPMLAKVITHAPTRLYAIEKMKQALNSTLLMGNINNIWYLKNILNNSDFKTGKINTAFCEVFKAPQPHPTPMEAVVAATLAWQFKPSNEANNIWTKIGFFRITNQVKHLINNQLIEIQYQKRENEMSFSIKEGNFTTISDVTFEENRLSFLLDSIYFQFNWMENSKNELQLEREIERWKIVPFYQLASERGNKNSAKSTLNEAGIKAPIPGKIVAINIQVGEKIKAGDTLLVLEAMKMENKIDMPRDGIVKKIYIEPGKQVKANELLVEIENIEQ